MTKLVKDKSGKLIDQCRATHLKQAQSMLKAKADILEGNMISIDPASKSMGMSVFAQGEYQRYYLIKCEDPKAGIGERLYSMYNQLPDLEEVGTMVVELVRPRTGHIYLTWAAALCMIKYGPKNVIELSTGAWHKIKPDDYIKSDVLDSRLIGDFTIRICKEDDDGFINN